MDYEKAPPLPDDTRAADREDVLWSITYALMQCSWKLSQGGESGHALRQNQEYRRKAAAEQILKQLELSNFRFGKGPPRQPHGPVS